MCIEFVDALYLVYECIAIEYGSPVPVSVESEIRNSKIGFAPEPYITLDIAAVAIVCIEQLPRTGIQGYCNGNRLLAPCGYSDRSLARDGAIGLQVPRRSVHPVCILVIYLNARKSLRKDRSLNGVCEGTSAEIHDLEIKREYARLVGIVAKLKLGFGAAVNLYVRAGADSLEDVHNAGALCQRGYV